MFNQMFVLPVYQILFLVLSISLDFSFTQFCLHWLLILLLIIKSNNSKPFPTNIPKLKNASLIQSCQTNFFYFIWIIP